jgi:tRNA uridine 5-carboxymethylaminomethyl modification enzyme
VDIGSAISLRDLESALADSLYQGYIEAQRATFDRLHQHDGLIIPSNFDFQAVSGLSHEMVERLERARPQTFGQARRIPGLTPASISTLLIHLNIQRAA